MIMFLAIFGLILGSIGITGVALFWPEIHYEEAHRCPDCDAPTWHAPNGYELCRNVFCPRLREEKRRGA